MEVPAISGGGGYGSGGYALSPAYSATALQAGSSVSLDLPAGDYGPMSITIANQVNMVFAQMTRGDQIDPQTLKALIMLLLMQLLLNGGQGDQNQGALRELADAFGSSGRTEMSMVAMQASSMIAIEFGGSAMPDLSVQAGAAAGMDVLA